MTQFAQPGHCLGPAESFFNAFANALGNSIARVTGGAAVNCRTAAVGILSDMRGDRLVSLLHEVCVSFRPRSPWKSRAPSGPGPSGSPEPSFGQKLFGLTQASNSVPSTEKYSLDSSFLTAPRRGIC
jgi:hypothetical protein